MNKNEMLVALLVKDDANDPGFIGARAYAGARVELKDFNPSEPRDPHSGEWIGAGGSLARNNPAKWSRYSTTEVKDMQQAVKDAVQRHPELTQGRRPLRAVAFATGVKPRGISDREYAGARMKMASTRAAGITGSIPGVGSLIVMNDAVERRGPPQNPHHNVPADSTAYGLITHELGHTYFGALGYDDPAAAEQLLTKFGISPRTDLIGYSDYGAASPKEALAELYTQTHTPGHNLPPVLAQKYQRLEAYASTHPVNGAQRAPYWRPGVSPFLTSDPKLSRQIRQAASKNAEADAWVVQLPVLDG